MIKARTKRTPRKGKFSVGEHIRVVPLHQPIAAAPPQADLTYRGGALIQNVEVFTIFWGKLWGSSPASTDTMSKLNKFFGDILISPLNRATRGIQRAGPDDWARFFYWDEGDHRGRASAERDRFGNTGALEEMDFITGDCEEHSEHALFHLS
jgi:hypothetical protein